MTFDFQLEIPPSDVVFALQSGNTEYSHIERSSMLSFFPFTRGCPRSSETLIAKIDTANKKSALKVSEYHLYPPHDTRLRK